MEDTMPKGGKRVGAGRPKLGRMPRVTTVIWEGADHMNLSMLASQREYLADIGDGNRSAGFRQVLAFIDLALTAAPALRDAHRALLDEQMADESAYEIKTLLNALKEITPHENGYNGDASGTGSNHGGGA